MEAAPRTGARQVPVADPGAMPFQTPIHLETERLVVRPVAEADLADLLLVNGDDEVTRFLPYESWRSVDDGLAWLARMRKIEESGTGVQRVVIDKASGRAIGGCLLFRLEPASARAELGYVLGRRYWGRGLMREALAALIPHAFGTLGLRRLEAEVNPLNAPSCGLLERLGFRNEGLLRQRWAAKGAVYDTRFYGLLREEWSSPAPR
jgi:RimJ/RimL family protein N-acetyltransferase